MTKIKQLEDQVELIKNPPMLRTEEGVGPLNAGINVHLVEAVLEIIKEIASEIEFLKAQLKGMKWYEVWKFKPVLDLVESVVTKILELIKK